MEERLDVLELTRKLGREPNVDTALDIMQWELGDMQKSWTYTKWHPGEAKAYKAEAIHALGDLLFQAEVVGQLLGVNHEEALAFGIMTVEDRIEEMENKVGRFRNYEGR